MTHRVGMITDEEKNKTILSVVSSLVGPDQISTIAVFRTVR